MRRRDTETERDGQRHTKTDREGYQQRLISDTEKDCMTRAYGL